MNIPAFPGEIITGAANNRKLAVILVYFFLQRQDIIISAVQKGIAWHGKRNCPSRMPAFMFVGRVKICIKDAAYMELSSKLVAC